MLCPSPSVRAAVGVRDSALGSLPVLPFSRSCHGGLADGGSACWVFCRKAEEYLRLSQVKCAGLMAQMTATSSAVMCLDLAASFMKQPVDKVRYSM